MAKTCCKWVGNDTWGHLKGKKWDERRNLLAKFYFWGRLWPGPRTPYTNKVAP